MLYVEFAYGMLTWGTCGDYDSSQPDNSSQSKWEYYARTADSGLVLAKGRIYPSVFHGAEG